MFVQIHNLCFGVWGFFFCFLVFVLVCLCRNTSYPAPLSNNTLHTVVWPSWAASCKAVLPSLSVASTLRNEDVRLGWQNEKWKLLSFFLNEEGGNRRLRNEDLRLGWLIEKVELLSLKKTKKGETEGCKTKIDLDDLLKKWITVYKKKRKGEKTQLRNEDVTIAWFRWHFSGCCLQRMSLLVEVFACACLFMGVCLMGVCCRQKAFSEIQATCHRGPAQPSLHPVCRVGTRGAAECGRARLPPGWAGEEHREERMTHKLI